MTTRQPISEEELTEAVTILVESGVVRFERLTLASKDRLNRCRGNMIRVEANACARDKPEQVEQLKWIDNVTVILIASPL